MLEQKEVKDATLMRVTVSGKKKMSDAQYTYEMIDYYDDERGITSMARTTGYTCSIACQMVARGDINMKGVVPPEKAFQGEHFKKLTVELAKRNLHFQETFTTSRYMNSQA
jgi:lysine 6-dehydrogenase